MTTLTVSAPGKVLIAGGYLVLDPMYNGLVISTSSRFYTVISEGSGLAPGHITVKSPQFLNAEWSYIAKADGDTLQVEQVSMGDGAVSKNKFVQLALQRTLLLAMEIKGRKALEEYLSEGISIVILGDNDFYSQRAQLAARGLPRTIAALSSLPPFVPCGVALSDVHKTGLGSSAALITSLVCALLVHTGVISRDSVQSDEITNDLSLVHNVAQYIHCLAQGKVGSGFDVSSAVFGSQLYKRFDPSVLQHLMTDNMPTEPLQSTLSPTNKAWDYKISPFQLPPLTRLMLADVDAGSDTPSLVGKVLKWRKDDHETALHLWTDISEANGRLGALISHLSALYDINTEAYTLAVSKCVDVAHDHWGALFKDGPEKDVTEVFTKLWAQAECVRFGMRAMGTLAGVPIEPDAQTKLLDACVSVAGVLGGGVPGAGGFDAVWLLVLEAKDSSPVTRVEKVWSGWTEMNVSPLSATESHARGVRIEDPLSVPGLSSIIDNQN